jgi:peroxiredoxin
MKRYTVSQMRSKLFLLLLVCVLGSAALASAELGAGAAAPLFQLKSVAGKPVNLTDQLGTKATIVAFFTSWSQSCRQEIALLQELAEQDQNSGLKIIGVSFDRKTEELKKFLADNKLTFPIAHDRKLTTLKEYRILIIPTLFVLDAEGKISNTYVDFDSNVAETVRNEVKGLLAPEPIRNAEQ